MKRQSTLPLVIFTMTLITATFLAPFAFAENSKRRLVTIHPHGSIDTIALGVPALAQKFTDWSAPVNLGSPVNSGRLDGTPFLSKNGRDLFFASNRDGVLNGPNDIYVSHRETRDSPWEEPVSLGPDINTPQFEEFAPFLTSNGRYLYFISNRPGGCGNSDMWVSRRLSRRSFQQWSPPENLGCQVNSVGIELGPSLFKARDDDEDATTYLYFSSGLRPGGMGFGDIYVSTLQPDGTFGPPSPILEFNTPFNEIRPTIRARDGLEIFFDSFRPGVIGGSAPDLYTSTRECLSCPWNPPENLGSTVNSASIDGGAKLSFDATELYFMSNRPGGLGGQDIYVIRRERIRDDDDDDEEDDG